MNASKSIDEYITGVADWRGNLISRLRKLILDAAPVLVEEWKWDTPVWSYNGTVVAIGVFKDKVKMNFFKGAALKDPQHLFNSGLDAKKSRTIDIFEHDDINEDALKDLIQAAVALNER